MAAALTCAAKRTRTATVVATLTTALVFRVLCGPALLSTQQLAPLGNALALALATTLPVLLAHKLVLQAFASTPPATWRDLTRHSGAAAAFVAAHIVSAGLVAWSTRPRNLLQRATISGPVAVDPSVVAYVVFALCLAVAHAIARLTDLATFELNVPPVRVRPFLADRIVVRAALSQGLRDAIVAVLVFGVLYPLAELLPLPGIISPALGVFVQRSVETEHMGLGIFSRDQLWSHTLLSLALLFAWDLVPRLLRTHTLQPANTYRMSATPITTLATALQSQHPIIHRYALLDLHNLAEPLCRPLRQRLYFDDTTLDGQGAWSLLIDAALRPVQALANQLQAVQASHKAATAPTSSFLGRAVYEPPTVVTLRTTATFEPAPRAPSTVPIVTPTVAMPAAPAPSALAAPKAQNVLSDMLLNVVFGPPPTAPTIGTGVVATRAVDVNHAPTNVPLAFRPATVSTAAPPPTAATTPSTSTSGTSTTIRSSASPSTSTLSKLLPRALTQWVIDALHIPAPAERTLVEHGLQAQMYLLATEGIAKLLVLSLDEDDYGTAQPSMARVLTVLVDCYTVLESLVLSPALHEIVPASVQTRTSLRRRYIALHESLRISLISVVRAYGVRLRDLPLSAPVKTRLANIHTL